MRYTPPPHTHTHDDNVMHFTQEVLVPRSHSEYGQHGKPSMLVRMLVPNRPPRAPSATAMSSAPGVLQSRRAAVLSVGTQSAAPPTAPAAAAGKLVLPYLQYALLVVICYLVLGFLTPSIVIACG